MTAEQATSHNHSEPPTCLLPISSFHRQRAECKVRTGITVQRQKAHILDLTVRGFGEMEFSNMPLKPQQGHYFEEE